MIKIVKDATLASLRTAAAQVPGLRQEAEQAAAARQRAETALAQAQAELDSLWTDLAAAIIQLNREAAGLYFLRSVLGEISFRALRRRSAQARTSGDPALTGSIRILEHLASTGDLFGRPGTLRAAADRGAARDLS